MSDDEVAEPLGTSQSKADDDDDDFEFDTYADPKPAGAAAPAQAKAPTVVSNQHHDEAVDVSDESQSLEDSHENVPERATQAVNASDKSDQSASNGSKKDVTGSANGNGTTGGASAASPAGGGGGGAPAPTSGNGTASAKDKQGAESESESEESEEEGTEPARQPSQAKLYNPQDYKNLNVPSEIQDLFDYIGRHKAIDIELDTKLKPFIPDYIPAVGEIDSFIKIPPPDNKKDGLGLTVLDEPAAAQSDPGVLDMKLRLFSTENNLKPVAVRSIEMADKNPKKVTSWITKIEEVHRKKPPPTVSYTKPMPDIDSLMQAWHAEFEETLKESPLPSADLDLDVATFSKVTCALLDIPVYDKITESLHLLFTLYSEFSNHSHFNR